MKTNSLNPTQLANFVYWIQEYHDLRGVNKQLNPKMKLAHIEHVLLPEFLKKYPDGILKGWS